MTRGPISAGHIVLIKFILRRERGSAAAAAGGIRVIEGKARTHHIRRVIDRDTGEVLRRKHIDKKTNVVLVNDKVALTRFFLDVQAVLKARAAARYNADAKSGGFRQIVFAGKKLFDLFSRTGRNGEFNRR